MIIKISLQTPGQGLHEITDRISTEVERSGLAEGLCTVFLAHTSASLCIQENADPSAKKDLEKWLNRLVPENDPHFTHTFEGPDDMPSHIKSALTTNSIGIPILNHSLCLGTWQGIYLWEHRTARHQRNIIIHISS